jgi:hypothetical protein
MSLPALSESVILNYMIHYLLELDYWTVNDLAFHYWPCYNHVQTCNNHVTYSDFILVHAITVTSNTRM